MGEDLHNHIALQDGSNDLTPASAPPRVRGQTNLEHGPVVRQKGRVLHLGPSTLAVLSHGQDGRRGNPLYDMDFWTDHSRSVYRPFYTLEKLQKHPNFQYQSGILVKSFRDNATGVTVDGVDVASS